MEILNDTCSRDLLRRDGIRVSSELTTRQRDEVQRYRRQGKIAYYKNGRLQVEERRANPAVDSRRRNSLRDTNDDQEGRGWTGRYHPRQIAPSTGTRQSSHDPADPRRSRPPGTRGVSRYGSRDRERDWNYISQTRNNVKEQKRPMNAGDSWPSPALPSRQQRLVRTPAAEPWTVLAPRSVAHHGGLQPR